VRKGGTKPTLEGTHTTMPFRHGLIEPVIAARPAVGGVAFIVTLITLTLQARQGTREAAAQPAPGARADTPAGES
jgi:hypothetical protein